LIGVSAVPGTVYLWRFEVDSLVENIVPIELVEQTAGHFDLLAGLMHC
jgi:hypothetical protein